MSDSEYLIHGTQIENAIRILKLGKLQADPPKKYLVMLDRLPSKQIFTQLIYKDIPNQETNTPHWGMVCFVLSKQLLKDYPFYSTRVGGFRDKFEDAFKKTVEDKEPDMAKIIIKSPKGGLSRMPNLTKLKHHINEFCKNNVFMYSHEILFNKDIPLDKYCIAVITNPFAHTTEIEKLCIEKGIHYETKSVDNESKLQKRSKTKGINKIIELANKPYHPPLQAK